jgi:transmembrane sensor
MGPDHVFDATIARYLEGHCTPREEREFNAWMEADPTNRARVEECRAIWSLGEAAPAPSADAMWSRLQRRMGGRASPRHGPRINRAARRGWKTPITTAASLLIIAGAVVALSIARHQVTGPPPITPQHEYATGRGERATVRLADGSVVTLAAGSRVRIPAEFGATTRELSLDGEAIFEVAHDAAHPFRVRAGRALIEDIGTRFDVRAYGDESTVAVAVADGAVVIASVRGGHDSNTHLPADTGHVLIGRGQLGRLEPDGRVSSASGIQLPRYFGWADGHLVFVKAPLPEVLRTIGRWYDLDIRVPDPLLAKRLVSGEFSTQAPSEMLDALAAAVDARFARAGRVVSLSPVP